MYLPPISPFNNCKDQAEGLSQSSSFMSNLSCATAQPQLSSECLSSTNSEGSILNSLASSPCHQSSYSSAYINPFQAPHSPRPVTSPLGNSALLEQTAVMMKAATAALHSLQSSPQLYHSPSRQQPTRPFCPSQQQTCYAPQQQAPAMPAVPVRNSSPCNFVAVQTAPSASSMGMQALEELMMSDSSQDSSPYADSSALHSVQSAPASFYTQGAQAWGSTTMPCPSQQAQQEAAAQHSMDQMFENITRSAEAWCHTPCHCCHRRPNASQGTCPQTPLSAISQCLTARPQLQGKLPRPSWQLLLKLLRQLSSRLSSLSWTFLSLMTVSLLTWEAVRWTATSPAACALMPLLTSNQLAPALTGATAPVTYWLTRLRNSLLKKLLPSARASSQRS